MINRAAFTAMPYIGQVGLLVGSLSLLGNRYGTDEERADLMARCLAANDLSKANDFWCEHVSRYREA